MTIDWRKIGQEDFDRVVEVLLGRHYRHADRFEAVDGRGGDGGIDIDVEIDGRRIIFQLKYFPEGFSNEWGKSRKPQIRRSFRKALVLKPDEWVLVVPRNLAPGESQFVDSLRSDDGPEISVTGRRELDNLLVDFPEVDRWYQRNALREDAIIFNAELATLQGGADDLTTRVRNLGKVVDAVDPHWTLDFQRLGDTVVHSLRAQHPQAHIQSPITINFTGQFGPEHAELAKQFRRSIGYGTSDPIELPGEVVKTFRIEGPELIATHGEVERVILTPLKRSQAPAVGKPFEIQMFDEDDTLCATHEGRVTRVSAGDLGVSIESSFYDDRTTLKLIAPYDKDSGHAEVGITKRVTGARPGVVSQVQAMARQIRQATTIAVLIDGRRFFVLGNPDGEPEIDDNDLIVEEFADDLDVVQRHCSMHFAVPEEISNVDRVAIRVARVIIEGGIIASPDAEIFTRALTGLDTPEVRAELTEPVAAAWRSETYTVKLGNRALPIGPVYAIHPAAIALEPEKALAALDAGQAEGHLVRYAPSDGLYFYIALADRPIERFYGQRETLWDLYEIEQPRPLQSGSDESEPDHTDAIDESISPAHAVE